MRSAHPRSNHHRDSGRLSHCVERNNCHVCSICGLT
jgi:hypothetical protein